MCHGSISIHHVHAVKISETEVIITNATVEYMKEVWRLAHQENPNVTPQEICDMIAKTGLSAGIRPLLSF